MIAITGDIHGCLRTLESTVKKITKRCKISTWYFLGDIMDRGAKSRETTDFIIDMSKEFEVKLLLGNHEDMMMSYLLNDNRYPHMMWPNNGGNATIKSFTGGKYNKSHAERHYTDICRYFGPYMDFFKSFSLYEELFIGDTKYLISHAGIANSRLPLDEQHLPYSEAERLRHPSFLWEKQAIYNHKGYKDYILIFGHTPVFKTALSQTPQKPYIIKNTQNKITSIAADTGCVYGYTLSTLLLDEDGSVKSVSVPCKD